MLHLVPRDPIDRARCRDVRARLRSLIDERLKPDVADDVRHHVLECQACGEALAEMILGDVASGLLPTEAPPVVPSFEPVARYWQACAVAFGTPWRMARDALQAPKGATRDDDPARWPHWPRRR